MRFFAVVFLFDILAAGVYALIAPPLLSFVAGVICGAMVAYWRRATIQDDAWSLYNRFKAVDSNARAAVEGVLREAERRMHLGN